jgi:hypothetical protein
MSILCGPCKPINPGIDKILYTRADGFAREEFRARGIVGRGGGRWGQHSLR